MFFQNLVEIITDNKNLSLKDDEIKTIAIRAIERLKTKNTTSKSFLCFYKVYIKNNYIIIELNDEHIKFMLEEVKISSKIENILDEYGVKDYKIIFSVGDFSKEILNIEEKIKMDIEKHQNSINAEIRLRTYPPMLEKSPVFGLSGVFSFMISKC